MHEKYALCYQTLYSFHNRTSVINFQKLTADPHYIISVSAMIFCLSLLLSAHLIYSTQII